MVTIYPVILPDVDALVAHSYPPVNQAPQFGQPLEAAAKRVARVDAFDICFITECGADFFAQRRKALAGSFVYFGIVVGGCVLPLQQIHIVGGEIVRFEAQ
jgi:hypothetical protein